MATAVLLYDTARRAIAEAKTFDEVREWEDKAAAVREYGRRIHDRSMELDALEIREQARRRRGELLLDLKREGRLVEGKPSKTIPDQVGLSRVTLVELAVSPNESSRDQKLAKMDGDSFTRLMARCRQYAEEHPEKHSFANVPVNGARSIMNSRQEPDDSLDYFPTPPWATRALMERVFPNLFGDLDWGQYTAWEPACGEGHIAEVLDEYFERVYATDIHDYGYGDQLTDFLRPDIGSASDWIITNPPFNDKAEGFVLRALEQAQVGVAMFLRLQWLETIGRYERIFEPHPPAMIAQFAERVPLHKGRWEPDGDTATAYLWIIWLKNPNHHTRFFWIPPGCRDTLTRPDDVLRFTANPVTRKNSGQLTDAESPAPAPCHEPNLTG